MKGPLSLALVAGLSALCQGFDAGMINFSTTLMPQEFKKQKQIFLIVGTCFSVAGAAMCSWSNLNFGRRMSMIGTNVLLIVSYVMYAAASHPWMVIVSRAVSGFAMGVAETTSPIIISTVAPRHTRGCLIGTQGILFVIGQILSNVTNYILTEVYKVKSNGWKFFICPAIVISTIQLSLFLLTDINVNIDGERRSLWQCLRTSFGKKGVWKGLCGASIPQILKHTIGVNLVVYDGPEVIERGGLTRSSFSGNVVVLGILGSTISICSVDRCGRRMVLIISLAFMASSLYFLSSEPKIEGQTDLFKLAMMWLYFFFYSFGMLAVPITISSEIFPPEFKEVGCSIASMIGSTTNLIVSTTFKTAHSNLGSKMYVIHMCICLTGLILVGLLVPETSNCALSEVEQIVVKFSAF